MAIDLSKVGIGLVGFALGLIFNPVMDITQSVQDQEIPAHVLRYEHLTSYQNHPIDSQWAPSIEKTIKEAFAASSKIKLSGVKCYTDVCAMHITSKNRVENDDWHHQWQLINAKLPATLLRTTIRAEENSSSNSQLDVYQFERS